MAPTTRTARCIGALLALGCQAAATSAGGVGASSSLDQSATNGGQASGGASTSSPPPVETVSDPILGLVKVEGVATWKNAATAAYSIIHDDACDYTLDSLFSVADPELTRRGLRAGFGAIVERCQERGVWDKLRALAAHGHEILCHSFTHPDFVAEAADLSVQMDQATALLAMNLPDQKLEYFIFPYDSFTEPMIAHLHELGYTGARAGVKGINPPDFSDALRESFDVYGHENSIYWPQNTDVLEAYVDAAIQQGGWAIRELHGVEDQSWEPVPAADYEAHLDYVAAKVQAGSLWVDTPSAVGHYRFARKYCGVPVASGDLLHFPSPSADCVANASVLSVVITTERDAPALVATQAGQALTTKKLGANRFVVDALPTGGDVVLQDSSD
ncbi:MAG TPA: polysaccharide deacetylase family protein [Polyangiaceae bacterium]|nr:polysaccharide deacetylase family protein [Polyangiaceae bacterium]